MLVRQATPKDFPHILRMYKEGLDELSEPWDEACLFKNIIKNFQLAPCFILDIDGIISGIAGLTVIISSHTGTASLEDYMLYVEKEHRTFKNLNALINASKQFAEAHDMPLKVDFYIKDDLKIRQRILERHNFVIQSVRGVYNA